MYEERILSEIKKRVAEDGLVVTYPWLQQTFNIGPKKAEEYLNLFNKQVNGVNAEYLKTVVNNIENFVIVSLKSTSDYKVDITDYEISDNKRIHFIVCNEAKCIPRKIKSNIENNKPSKLVTVAADKSIIKKECHDSKLFKPITDQIRISDSSAKKELEPKPISKIVAKPKNNKQAIIKTETASKKPSEITNTLFNNFENEILEKPNKRRRLIIESDEDDDIIDDDKILVNDSMKEESEEIILESFLKHESKIVKDQSKVEVPARKVLKQVERTYIDDEGFLVTKKVFEDVSRVEEIKHELKIKSPLKKIVGSKISKVVNKKSVYGSRDSKKSTQMNLTSFFQKKA